MRIAVCDDDEREIDHLSALITEYQSSRGVSLESHFFHNSIDFLCDVKGGEYDLVLLDVVMPGVGGIKLQCGCIPLSAETGGSRRAFFVVG